MHPCATSYFMPSKTHTHTVMHIIHTYATSLTTRYRLWLQSYKTNLTYIVSVHICAMAQLRAVERVQRKSQY